MATNRTRTIKIKQGKEIANGKSKQLFSVVETNENDGFTMTFGPGQTVDNFLIGTFKVDSEFNGGDVYNEFVLYSELGEKDHSPKIHGVITNDGKQTSLRKFITDNTTVENNTKFIIEKNDCDKLIMKYFLNYTIFFQNLSAFFVEIVNSGYYNTDIKIPNLCIDPKTLIFKMIDLDPKFMKQLTVEERTPEINKHYINYMIYQVYIFLTVGSKQKIHISKTGIDTDVINRPNFYKMIDFIYIKNNQNTHKSTDTFDPLFMLFWYSKQYYNNNYRNRNHIFNDSKDIANFFDSLVVIAIGDVSEPIEVQSPPDKKSWLSSVLNDLLGRIGLAKGKKSRKNGKKYKQKSKKPKKTKRRRVSRHL